MICIFFEGEQYLEEVIYKKIRRPELILEQTPYGLQRIYLDSHNAVIYLTNAGHYGKTADREVPKTVAWILEKYQVRGMAMISKVGGINKLLSVGDVILADDYIDRTSIYEFSYKNSKKEEIPRYDMIEPFSEEWRNILFARFRKNQLGIDRNILRKGTYICTNGPGFESKSEIKAYQGMGADIVGHYLSPYTYYCRELKIAFVVISVVSNVYGCDELLKDNKKTMDMLAIIIKTVMETFQEDYCEEQKKHWIKNLP